MIFFLADIKCKIELLQSSAEEGETNPISKPKNKK
jgi:hypothetical protein